MTLAVISIDLLKSWILDHGWYAGAFISFALLFLCGLGLPVPEDVPLILTGAFLVQDPHGSTWQEWLIVGGLNWLGIIGGDVMLYSLGRRYGKNVTRLPWIGKHVTIDRLDKLRGWFDRYGVGVVAVGRLMAGIRGAMVLTAGTIRFNFWKFIIADGIAAIVSGGLFMLLGHWIGDKLTDQTIKQYEGYFTYGAIAAGVLLAAFIAWKLRAGGHKPIIDVPPVT